MLLTSFESTKRRVLQKSKFKKALIGNLIKDLLNLVKKLSAFN